MYLLSLVLCRGAGVERNNVAFLPCAQRKPKDSIVPRCEHYYEFLRKPKEVPDTRVSLNSSVKCERRCVFASAKTSQRLCNRWGSNKYVQVRRSVSPLFIGCIVWSIWYPSSSLSLWNESIMICPPCEGIRCCGLRYLRRSRRSSLLACPDT